MPPHHLPAISPTFGVVLSPDLHPSSITPYIVVLLSPLANQVERWATTKALKSIATSFECSACSRRFDTRQKYSVHLFKVHHIKSIERKYVNTTHCPICMIEFWTRERILNHLRYKSQVCRQNLLLRGPLLSDCEADSLDRDELVDSIRPLSVQLLRRHHTLKPCFRLPGPLPHTIIDPATTSDHHSLGIGRQYRSS